MLHQTPFFQFILTIAEGKVIVAFIIIIINEANSIHVYFLRTPRANSDITPKLHKQIIAPHCSVIVLITRHNCLQFATLKSNFPNRTLSQDVPCTAGVRRCLTCEAENPQSYKQTVKVKRDLKIPVHENYKKIILRDVDIFKSVDNKFLSWIS